VQCTPSEIEERTALLSLTTNDPNHSTVTYPLECIGIGARYDSIPKPDSILKIDIKADNPTTVNITISEKGTKK